MPEIKDVTITPLRVISDPLGSVKHVLRADSPVFRKFGEVYISTINPGVVKGWKLHSRQWSNLAVPAGQVKYVLHDRREDSPTKGVTQEVCIGDDNYCLLTIPPGVAYAWKNPSSEMAAQVVNCATEPHEAGECQQLPLAEIAHAI